MTRSSVSARSRSRGFTLIELVVAITIGSILLGIIAMTTTAPVDRYLEQSRRGDAMSTVDRVVARMTDDLQHALPNSVRRGRFANTDVFQMLDVDDIVYYQPAPVTGDTNVTLRFDGGTADRFDAYGLFTRTPTWLVVNNLGVPGSDAYAPAYRAWTTVNAAGNYNAKATTLPAGFAFAVPSPTNRMFAVRQPITYVCDRTAGTLTRYAAHSIAANIPVDAFDAQLNSAGTTTTLMATGIAACRFDCPTVAGSGQTCARTLIVDVVVRRGAAPDDENVRMFHEFLVDNAP